MTIKFGVGKPIFYVYQADGINLEKTIFLPSPRINDYDREYIRKEYINGIGKVKEVVGDYYYKGILFWEAGLLTQDNIDDLRYVWYKQKEGRKVELKTRIDSDDTFEIIIDKFEMSHDDNYIARDIYCKLEWKSGESYISNLPTPVAYTEPSFYEIDWGEATDFDYSEIMTSYYNGGDSKVNFAHIFDTNSNGDKVVYLYGINAGASSLYQILTYLGIYNLTKKEFDIYTETLITMPDTGLTNPSFNLAVYKYNNKYYKLLSVFSDKSLTNLVKNYYAISYYPEGTELTSGWVETLSPLYNFGKFIQSPNNPNYFIEYGTGLIYEINLEAAEILGVVGTGYSYIKSFLSSEIAVCTPEGIWKNYLILKKINSDLTINTDDPFTLSLFNPKEETENADICFFNSEDYTILNLALPITNEQYIIKRIKQGIFGG